MKVVEITLKTTLVAQFIPGEIKAIVDSEGTVYLPAMNIPLEVCSGGCDCSGKAEEDSEEETKPEKPAKKEAPVAEKMKSVQVYSEDDLMEMKTKDMEALLRDSYDIEPNDYDGKNTNKKLRKLIIQAQGGSETPEEKEEETSEEEEKGGVETEVAKAIEDFEEGVSKKKTAAIIAGLLPKMDTDDIIDILEAFEENEGSSVDETVSKLMGKPAKEELVEVKDLEKDDKVSVYWNDENKSWFNGVVAAISRKGRVTVDYIDGTSEEIDPEIHTKIKRIG